MLLVFFIPLGAAHAQFYNKEVRARILVERNSEFYTFKATAENITPSDLSLRYDLMLFVKDENGNVNKSNQENRFFLKANEKLLLGQATVNYNAEGNITLVLLIYDLNDKPIGQDRIELKDGGRSVIEDISQREVADISPDQAVPQDGYVLDGLVLKKTITKPGKDFYNLFFQDYYNRGIKTTKNIFIEEVPGRGRSTRISVKVEERLVWQFFSQPRRDFLKKMADIAMQRVLRELQRLQQVKDEFIRY